MIGTIGHPRLDMDHRAAVRFAALLVDAHYFSRIYGEIEVDTPTEALQMYYERPAAYQELYDRWEEVGRPEAEGNVGWTIFAASMSAFRPSPQQEADPTD